MNRDDEVTPARLGRKEPERSIEDKIEDWVLAHPLIVCIIVCITLESGFILVGYSIGLSCVESGVSRNLIHIL